jgi:Methyltransferase domain
MALDRILYRLTYRLGVPRWDTGKPQPEPEQLVPGRPPGRPLHLGCGTGADAIYLAGHGWEAVGIDFAPEAIAAAKKKAADAGGGCQPIPAVRAGWSWRHAGGSGNRRSASKSGGSPVGPSSRRAGRAARMARALPQVAGEGVLAGLAAVAGVVHLAVRAEADLGQGERGPGRPGGVSPEPGVGI